MAEPAPEFYWDSSVFLSYLNATADRIAIVGELLDRAGKGELRLVTSTLTLAEVNTVATEQAGGMLTAEHEAAIDALWADRDAVRLVEVHEFIAREARTLIRSGRMVGWSLKPADAVHLATAARAGVAECHTYDTAWLKYRDATGLPVIREPQLTGFTTPMF